MILETIAQIVQVVSFIFVGFAILVLVSSVHRVYRAIYGKARGLVNAPSIGIIRLPRDVIMILIFGFFGSMGLLVTNSLMGYNVFTEKTLIGKVEYLRRSTTDPSMIVIRYQKTDEDGNPVGNPIELETAGDSIVLWYTIVTVKPTFLQLGKKQVYKIDYLGGDFWKPMSSKNLSYAAIEGGRQQKFLDMRESDKRPFPYSLWVDTVQFMKVEYKINDFNNKLTCDVLLAHNAIQFDNPTLSEISDDELILKEIGLTVRNAGEYGVEVTSIQPNSLAANAETRDGDSAQPFEIKNRDIILRINDMGIENIENMRFNLMSINKSDSEVIKFGIKRDKEETNVWVKFSSKSRKTIESDLE